MATLVRDLRQWDVTALVVNTVIGAGIFGLPSAVFALVGGASLLAYVVSAIAIFLIILCFAEVASRFSTTGGPYVYTHAAFGPLAAFEIGWLMWLSRCSAFAALCNLLIGYLDYFVPGIAGGVWRIAAAVVIATAFAFVNVIGVRASTRVTNVLTVGKLVPLVLVAGVGLMVVKTPIHLATGAPTYSSFAQAALLLAFAYMGFEGAVIPSGEVREPARHLAFGLLTGFAVIVAVYLALQFVCMGLVPDLAHSQRPLADAAVQALGPRGASLVALAAVLSIGGTLNSITFATSRLVLAMGEHAQLPALFARTHPTYRTPVAATIATVAVALVMTLFSTFLSALTISTVTRLIAYATTCAALPVLRRRFASRAPFFLRAGTAIAAVSVALTMWLLTGSSWAEMRLLLAAVAVGLAMYALTGGKTSMTAGQRWPSALIIGALFFVAGIETGRDMANAQTHTRVFITRMFTGPDKLTHAEDVEATFAPVGGRDVSPLMKITGASLHRNPPGTSLDWHPAPARQYVITLSGHGELEVAGGKKIEVGPGHVELAEDLTGKGHITKTVGNEDRITLWLPLSDQTPATK